MKTLETQRHLFDIPDEIAYFNCAYFSPQLKESSARLITGVNAKAHPWEKTVSSFFDDAETIRQQLAALFGGDADGYAITPSVSYGISTAARAVEPTLRKADKILVIADEFPSTIYPWKRVANETGAQIITVLTPGDGNWTQAIIKKIQLDTKVVSVSSCHWTNGAKIDLTAIGKACRENGSVFVVDTTQSLGALPFSMDDVQPDFLASAGYKWLLCPYGFSALYVSEKWRNSRPLEESWFARNNAQDFSALALYCDEYLPGSRRFDVGEKCTPTILPGVIAALEQITKWGVACIAETLSEVNKVISNHLLQLGFQLPEEQHRCPHMFGAKLPLHFTGDLVSKLKTQNIFITQRGNSLRFAPHLYINEHDIKKLLDALTVTLKE